MLLVLLLVPMLLLLLAEVGHLGGPMAMGWWEKSEGATCCRLAARIRALRWWKTGGRQDWLEGSAEVGVGARTTMMTAVSWRAIYCFADAGRVDFDNTSYSGRTKMSHLYFIKLSHLCQP